MINIDCNNGTLNINEKPISSAGMMDVEFNMNFLKDCVSTTKDKKSTFYRIEPIEDWIGYSVESIVVEFNLGKCKGIFINLLQAKDETDISTADLRITAFLRNCLHSQEKKLGKSEIQFKPSWGIVSVIYDIKISAPSVSIIYG